MNVALVGYGYWGKVWQGVLDREPGVTLTHICHRTAAHEGLFTNDRNQLVSDQVAAVIVATPVPTHYELVKFFLERGKHVLCEKPLTLQRSEAGELTNLARKNKLVLETNYTYLHSPAVQHMKTQLPKIGRVYALEGNIDGFGNFYRGEDVFSVHCPHLVALVVDLFPHLDFQVQTFNLVFSKLGTVDVGNIQLTTDGLAVNIHSSLRGIKRERKIAIYGSSGVMEYDATSPEQFKMKLYTEVEERLIEGGSESAAFDESQNISRSFHKFLQCIKGGLQTNAELSVRASALLEQITASIKRN
jgi:predicted dehydrogenase